MIIRLVNQAFKIKRLRAENKRLKEELEQKEITIQYLNACVSWANKRYKDLYMKIAGKYMIIDFPNSSVEAEGQISINDILEN